MDLAISRCHIAVAIAVILGWAAAAHAEDAAQPSPAPAEDTVRPSPAPASSRTLADTPFQLVLPQGLYIVAFAFSWGPVMWVLLGEMFPNRMRGAALAISGATNWVTNFAVTVTFLPLLSAVGLAGAYAAVRAGRPGLAALRVGSGARDARQDAGTDVAIDVSQPFIGFTAARKKFTIARRTVI